ncbi:MAG: hypothetical protein MJ176_09740 [Treponema sp.]|nr:hypothetical protein [Treponema sp.]
MNEEYEASAREAEIREAKIKARTIKKSSNTFLAFACLLQITITVLVILALIILVALFAFKVMRLTSENVGSFFTVFMVIVMGGGLVLGFMIYKRLIRLIVAKTGWFKKLSDDVMTHYFLEDEIIALNSGKPLPKKAKKSADKGTAK